MGYSRLTHLLALIMRTRKEDKPSRIAQPGHLMKTCWQTFSVPCQILTEGLLRYFIFLLPSNGTFTADMSIIQMYFPYSGASYFVKLFSGWLELQWDLMTRNRHSPEGTVLELYMITEEKEFRTSPVCTLDGAIIWWSIPGKSVCLRFSS